MGIDLSYRMCLSDKELGRRANSSRFCSPKPQQEAEQMTWFLLTSIPSFVRQF